MWQEIKSKDDLEKVIHLSDSKPIVLLKHSPRCMISSMAKRRLERETFSDVEYAIVDVISSRNVSDYISVSFDVKHESPQLFVLSKGRAVAHTSHSGVHSPFIKDALSELSTSHQ